MVISADARPVPVIWNATAGQKKRGPIAPPGPDQLKEALAAAGVIARIIPTDSEEEAHSVVEDAIAGGEKLIVGAGGDGTIAGALRATEDQITWGHRQVFERLDRMADELRADRSPRKLASAVTLYHVVVEASLAQPGQHMIEGYLEEFDVLPGFREGMRNVALDEQRHIGFGVKLLADLYRADPEPIQEAILDTIKEVLPWTSAVAKPPNWDRSYTECFGFTLEDLGEAGALSIEQKLRAVGLPVDDLPRFPMPMDLPPRERALRGQKMLKANLLGPDRPAHKDPEAVAIVFD
ncbi:MAG: diacylglycerol kinase family protein, partial [Halobacteriota archaeon]